MSDVVERAKAALEGITEGPWEHRVGPEDETPAEYFNGTLINSGEPLHVLIAASAEPQFAYVVPAITGDGPGSARNAEFIAQARTLVPELVAEVERLHTWDGLMSLVDEHYPTSIFPHFAGAPDNPDRDPGPRILSLLREVERLRAGGPWVEHVERERAMKRERDGDCICNRGPDTDGPDEFCPWHGREYGYLVSECVRLAAEVEGLKAREDTVAEASYRTGRLDAEAAR